ncbi:MAG: hypothetical protein L0Z50_36715 [Verrucomicrobiales bacterium]|nr:hypothetical protein [Verrucomicrobiales bacterium]
MGASGLKAGPGSRRCPRPEPPKGRLRLPVTIPRAENHWRPDRAFLSRRTREQLVVIAKESGFAEGRSCLPAYKKSELVDGLLVHFEGARLASDPTQAQRQALAWLPEIMHFPAAGPDAAQNGEAEAHAA